MDKVSIIIQSLIDSKNKYLEIYEPVKNETIYKICINADETEISDFLTDFFDQGFLARRITKEDFDTFLGYETINFNL